MKTTPAIVIVSEFAYSESKGTFSGYLDYMNRQDAKENNELKPKETPKGMYAEYTNYMADGEKNGSLFDENDDYIDADKKKNIIKNYHKAEALGSPLWKDVISFDNEWLEEEGLYNPKTHWLNESKMKDIIRSTMDNMIQTEKMRMPVWSASFHYNTDNLHVHIATVELDPTHMKKVHAKDLRTKKHRYDDAGEPVMQYRGKRKQGTLEKMKSTIANKVIDRTPMYKRMDELIRDSARKLRTADLRQQEATQELFMEAIELLPEDFRQWRYGYQSINEARPYIDQIGELYLNMYHQDEMDELEQILNEQVELSERLYGTESNHEQYKLNKQADLKHRIGNAVLTEMREYHRELEMPNQNVENNRSIKEGKYYYHFKPLDSVSKDFNDTMYHLNKAMRKTFHDYRTERNIAEFDRMVEGYEM